MLAQSQASATATASATAPPGRHFNHAVRRRALQGLMVLAGGGAIAAATAWVLRPAPPEAVMVGSHVVHRGTHLEGERLPPAHPLTALLPARALEEEPQGYTEADGALLRVRRHCAWGQPGRSPYRGSAVQALNTATLSATVVRQIAADIHAGRRVDRVHISNAVIRAERSGREFDPQHVAMTHGMTLCVDTRINFVRGHSEGGDLYEAMDDDGRIYAVMVPDVCGNVSVLGQRYVREAAPTALGEDRSGAAQAAAPAGDSATARTATPLSAPGATPASNTNDPRPWMRLPLDQRIRQLPDGLRFTDRESTPGRDRAGTEANAVSAPATWLLSGLALLALWLVRRRAGPR